MIYFDAFTAEREQFENFMTKNYYALEEDFEKDDRGSYIKEKAKFLYMGWLLSKNTKKRKKKIKHERNFVQHRTTRIRKKMEQNDESKRNVSRA